MCVKSLRHRNRKKNEQTHGERRQPNMYTKNMFEDTTYWNLIGLQFVIQSKDLEFMKNKVLH